jgi:hypothetical protein
MESLNQGSSNIPSIMNKGFYMTSEEFYAKFPEFKASEEKPIPLKKKIIIITNLLVAGVGVGVGVGVEAETEVEIRTHIIGIKHSEKNKKNINN